MRKVCLLLLSLIGFRDAVHLPLSGVPLSQASSLALSFEVASVKSNRNPPVSTTGARVISLRLALNRGTLTFDQLSLRNLLLQAYDIQRNQIVGSRLVRFGVLRRGWQNGKSRCDSGASSVDAADTAYG